MMILACLRWLDNFAGINLGVRPAEFGADAAVKVLNGPYTFFLADAFILTVPFWQLQDRRSRRLTWLGALLLLFVVLLNRRTAWLAIIVGLAVMMVRRSQAQPPGGRDGRRRRPAHHRGVRRPGRVEGRGADCRDVGGRHGHARLAHPRMV